MKQCRNEREIVLDLLLAQHQKGTFMNVLVRDALDRFPDLEPRRRAFIKRLAEGVVERKMELDAVLDRYSKKTHVRPEAESQDHPPYGTVPAALYGFGTGFRRLQ